MRSFKKTKPKNPTILQQQSNKLKQKLQLLKQQVTLKKQQKQMSKTASSLKGNRNDFVKESKTTNNKHLTTTTKNNQYESVDIKYQNALLQMKIENIEQKLKQKGIKSYLKLISLTDQEIDQWKDVVVGYRIKLKKYIKLNKNVTHKSSQPFSGIQIGQSRQLNKQSSHNHKNEKYSDDFLQTKNSMLQKNLQVKEQKNIQDIIKQREKVKTFVPIMRQYEQFQQEQYDYQNQNQIDQDEDAILQSFMKVFHPRKGILKDSTSKNQNTKINQNNKDPNILKYVHWSSEVEKMQKQFQRKNHRKYPKQAIKKQALKIYGLQSQNGIVNKQNKQKSINEIKYCWKCFRKIDIKENINFRLSQQNYFCSQKCEYAYNQQVQIFIQKLPDVDKQLQLQTTYHQKSKQEKDQYEVNEEDQENLQYVDLTIL